MLDKIQNRIGIIDNVERNWNNGVYISINWSNVDCIFMISTYNRTLTVLLSFCWIEIHMAMIYILKKSRNFTKNVSR